MGALIGARDWSATPLGPVALWPQSLRSALDIVLGSAFPSLLLWGADQVQLYNDAFREILGPKHPDALGQPNRGEWPKALERIAPLYRRVLAGETIRLDGVKSVLTRSGVEEEAWFDLSLGPVRDEAGDVAGMLVTAFETTGGKAFLLNLSDALRPLASSVAVQAAATRLLGEHLDVDRTCYVEIDEARQVATVERDYLRGTATSLVGEHPMGPFASMLEVVRAGRTFVVEDAETTSAIAADLPTYRTLSLCAFVSVPLIKNGELVAAMCAASAVPRRWTEPEIALVEEAAERTWSAVARARAEAALRRSEAKYRSLFDSIDEGFCIIELLFDRDGKPADYRFVETNAVFEQQSGLNGAVGMTVRELIPGIEDKWIETYGHVALTGEAVRFEDASATMGRWFDVYATRVGDAASRQVAILFSDISERKRADAALRESEGRLRALVRASSYAIYRMSPDWSEMRQLDGRGFIADTASPSDAWLGEYIHPDDQPRVMAAIRESVRAKRMFELEHRVRRLDGTLGWTLSRAVPLLDERGEIVEWFGAASDVTARKEAEARLRESEERFRQFAENSTDTLWIVDAANGRLEYLSPAFETTWGEGRERVMADLAHWAELVHPDDLPKVAGGLARMLGGETLTQEYRIVRPSDGAVRWILDTGFPVRDAEGVVRRGAGIAQDITERKEAEKTIERLAEQRRLALESARMGWWHVDPVSRDVIFDERFAAITGLRGPRLPHDALATAIHEDDRARVDAAMRAATRPQNPQTYAVEYRVVHAGGAIRWVRATGTAYYTGQVNERRRTSFAGTIIDITDRKFAEEQLRHADRMEAVGRLAGGVAHEANNQMAVVLGFADFVLERPDLPEAVRHDVGYIRRAADRTAQVTAQLLAFGRRQILRPTVLDLNGVIVTVAPVLRRTLGEASELVLGFEPELGKIRADAGQLEQVLVNLALNARDAMPEGGTLAIVTANAGLIDEDRGSAGSEPVPPGTYVRLEVRDTGRGMDVETRRRAFEPFFTTKGVGHGTGLGLASVYGIVKQSGGYIEVESEPGLGTGFVIYLPEVEAAPLDAPSAAPRPLAGSGETILIVEDDALVRDMMTQTLQRAGYRVLEAEDGQAALDLLGTAGPIVSAVVTDLAMPRMGGRTLGRHLRGQYPNVPILFTSGYTDDEVTRRGLLEDGQPFLQKPFAPVQLTRAVRHVLGPPLTPPLPDAGAPPAG